MLSESSNEFVTHTVMNKALSACSLDMLVTLGLIIYVDIAQNGQTLMARMLSRVFFLLWLGAKMS